MKNKLLHIIRTKPVFLYLLPVFFVLHGFTNNFFLVPVKEYLLLNIIYLGAALLLSLSFWLLYRDFLKANLVAMSIMAYNFFFGTVHDFLKLNFNNTFIIKYSFILPLSAVLLAILIIYLKKTKKTFFQIASYLNVLLLLLILLDTGALFLKLTKKRAVTEIEFPAEVKRCDTCLRPDIYLIIADEYAGKTQLEDIFSFDNTDFENALTKRNFNIIKHPVSNYNRTVYSMASLFNMSYLENLKNNKVNNTDLSLSMDLIEKSNVAAFLESNGYRIYNYSFFDFAGNPKLTKSAFLPEKKAFITAQTFTERAWKDLWFHFASKLKIQSIFNHTLFYNVKIDSLTRNVVLKKEEHPKFIYTHLVMPHFTYYFDSNGKSTGYKYLTDEARMNKKDYIGYLVYTNKKILELIDFISTNSRQPPVIILMSDHGFHQFKPDERVDNKYHFMNLNAVLFPEKNYGEFYDGISNVNQFRVVFNSLFGQQLLLLKDSTSFVGE